MRYKLKRAVTVLSFFERLRGDRSYFGGEQLTLAEVVAGTEDVTRKLLAVELGKAAQVDVDHLSSIP